MKKDIEHLEKYRVINGPMPSERGSGANGIFLIPHRRYAKERYQIIASDGMGWEHVSVTYYKKNKTPNWDDMCYIKDLFWGEEETVLQYHTPKSTRASNQNALHLWRPTGKEVPMPPTILVGAVTAEPVEHVDG